MRTRATLAVALPVCSAVSFALESGRMTPTQDQLERLQVALDRLPYRERLNMLWRLGVSAEDSMGVSACTAHAGWKLLHPQAPLSFDGSVIWCRQCWKWLTQ